MEHTPLNLCALVDRFLREQGFTRLFTRHGTNGCAIAATDMANNSIDVGYIDETKVVLLNNIDAYESSDVISAYDPRFFELLAEGLSYAKP